MLIKRGSGIKAKPVLDKLGERQIKEVHETKNWRRYRTAKPLAGGEYKTKKLNKNVMLVVQKK